MLRHFAVLARCRASFLCKIVQSIALQSKDNAQELGEAQYTDSSFFEIWTKRSFWRQKLKKLALCRVSSLLGFILNVKHASVLRTRYFTLHFAWSWRLLAPVLCFVCVCRVCCAEGTHNTHDTHKHTTHAKRRHRLCRREAQCKAQGFLQLDMTDTLTRSRNLPFLKSNSYVSYKKSIR